MRRMYPLFAALLSFLGVRVALAHGTAFFEFNPEISRSVNIATIETPTQPFQPENDFLSGFDVWIANPDESGSATFDLLDRNGTVLARKHVTIPHTTALWSGTRLHVDLEEQMRIANTETYRLQIQSPMTTLSLYYAERNRLLEHNTSGYPPSYAERLAGPAFFGAREQDVIFRFALYETRERIPPIISHATATPLSSEEVRIDFYANEPVDYRAEITPEGGGSATRTEFRNTFEFCREGISACALTLTTIPGAAYRYALFARDAWNNEATQQGSFAAPAPPPSPAPETPPNQQNPSPPQGDATAPAISNARVISATDRGVRVAWETDEAANARLSVEENARRIVATEDQTFELAHNLAIADGLSPETAYTAVITSTDPSGNARSHSLPFRTASPAAPGGEPPGGQPGTNPATASPPPQLRIERRGNELTVSWQTAGNTEPDGGYRIDILNAALRLERQATAERGAREFTVAGLPPDEYRIGVYAGKNGSLERIGEQMRATVQKAGPNGGRTPYGRAAFGFFFMLVAALPIVLYTARKRLRVRKKHH